MDEVYAEEVLQLAEDVEGELLNIAFEGHEEDYGEERVFSEEDGYFVSEEELEQLIEQIDIEQSERNLKIYEIEVVGEKTDAVVVFQEEVRVSVVVFLGEESGELVVGAHDTLADFAGVGAHLNENIDETALVLGELCILPQENLGIERVVLVVIVIEVKAIEDVHELGDEEEDDAVAGYPIESPAEIVKHDSF